MSAIGSERDRSLIGMTLGTAALPFVRCLRPALDVDFLSVFMNAACQPSRNPKFCHRGRAGVHKAGKRRKRAVRLRLELTSTGDVLNL
jgi:hypothetical protein